MSECTDIKSMLPDELKEALAKMGEKPFRAGQIFEWLHGKRVENYVDMTNLSKNLREKLSDSYPLTALSCVREEVSKVDGTRKYLFALPDNNVIESVWMKYHHGNSVCISSQVGCRMGCRFCASTLGGLVRSLTASEMLEQVYQIQRLTGERVSNIVIMGSGEPLENYENVVRFVRLVSHEKGLNLSQRNITISTCGIVPNIRRLADEELSVTLAISLHAPTDEKRKNLMPIANKYSIAEIMDACRYYFSRTGRRLTFEYALTGGQNDSDEDAAELARLLSRLNCHVNLIPVNPVRERSFIRPDRTAVLEFQNKLENFGINVTIRREMGSDINGACGQLRKSYLGDSREIET
uniref:23S rRNA (adenine(2503)-C(2))-methyltransferase RlmN n=1 Tax=Eubacterium cellulosolvens TaxID=29322 RepID=UPI0004802E68|nr:23S rRNA (adenine(2503)-C(2))-methyltransferase RlmN [[Eubacterium] cellulosolvens]